MSDLRTLAHYEEPDGLIVTVTEHEGGRYTLHTRLRWELGVMHLAFTEISRLTAETLAS